MLCPAGSLRVIFNLPFACSRHDWNAILHRLQATAGTATAIATISHNKGQRRSARRAGASKSRTDLNISPFCYNLVVKLSFTRLGNSSILALSDQRVALAHPLINLAFKYRAIANLSELRRRQRLRRPQRSINTANTANARHIRYIKQHILGIATSPGALSARATLKFLIASCPRESR